MPHSAPALATSWPARPRVPAAANGRAPDSGDLASASFEAHPDPQFVVASNGSIVLANRAGAGAFARTEASRRIRDQLATGASSRVRALRGRIAETIRTQVSSPAIELPLASGGSVTLRIHPLGALFEYALLAVENGGQPVSRPGARERFGFTPSESLVAERLTRGLNVTEIARQLGISIETVRCHLKQAFAKAGVHRQAELVAVLLGR